MSGWRWPWVQQAPPVLERPYSSVPAACPECGHLDSVILRPIYRHRITEVSVESWQCGDVVRCTRCTTEFCIGLQGVYKPKPPKESPPEDKKQQRRPDMATGYKDLPWNMG